MQNIVGGNLGIGAFASEPVEKLSVNGNTLLNGKVGINMATLDASFNDYLLSLVTNGSVSIGVNRANVLGYGSLLYFNTNDNTDPQWIGRYNAAYDRSEFRICIGDNTGSGTENVPYTDAFVVGVNKSMVGVPTAENWAPLFNINSMGNARLLGKLAADEVFVTANPLTDNFPDYVFGKGYKLMSLDSLKSYINENQHLPEVPSAEKVKLEGGFNMGELNTIMLKKIEELTLHIIRQEEQMKKQEERMKELEEQIKKK